MPTKPENYEQVKEYEKQVRPRILTTIEQVRVHSSNPRILKTCVQYEKGLLSATEVENRIRELLILEGAQVK